MNTPGVRSKLTERQGVSHEGVWPHLRDVVRRLGQLFNVAVESDGEKHQVVFIDDLSIEAVTGRELGQRKGAKHGRADSELGHAKARVVGNSNDRYLPGPPRRDSPKVIGERALDPFGEVAGHAHLSDARLP